MLRWLGVVLAGLLSANGALAHPHIWVDSQYQIVVDTPEIQTLNATWSMDVFTSVGLIQNYDTNGDGKLTGDERKALLSGLNNLKKDDFFVHLKLDNKPFKPKDVSITDFGFDKKQMLWAKLMIALPKPVNLDKSSLSIAFGDPEYYFAMVPLEVGLLNLSGKLAETCTPVSHDAKEKGIETWVTLHCQP